MKIGNNNVSAIKIGDSNVSKVYLGADEVWSAGGEYPIIEDTHPLPATNNSNGSGYRGFNIQALETVKLIGVRFPSGTMTHCSIYDIATDTQTIVPVVSLYGIFSNITLIKGNNYLVHGRASGTHIMPRNNQTGQRPTLYPTGYSGENIKFMYPIQGTYNQDTISTFIYCLSVVTQQVS